MNSRTRDELKNTKRIFEIMGFNYIDFNDKKVINYVVKSLKSLNTGAYVCIGTVFYQDAISDSLENLKVLGLEPYNKVSGFISTIPFMPIYTERDRYSCHITFSVSDDTLNVDKASGTIAHYKLPQTPDIMASFHIGHEHLHALKETYFEEYKDSQVFGDVITIFYELVMSDSYPEMKSEIYKFRLCSLKENLKHYENAVMQMKKSKTDKDLYKIIATRSGQYLNSFYYALLLFNLYKDNSKIILERVNKVLNHELTTREMLDNLGLLHRDNNDTYNNEFDAIKKCVKKV